ncbi:MAG: hypothetical protein KA831_03345 [Pyrinomonadaceae bacterium]|nr:hypothetical protein [Pyrinomonadaceae bacterium]
MRTRLFFGILIGLALLAATANAQTNTLTYQGRLTDNNIAAGGTYEMQFRVFDAAVAGNQLPVGTPVTLNFTVAGTNPVTVSNGAFTVQLNFGAGVFTGADRWLEISVRKPSDPPGFTLLTPRQPITSSPYAIKTINAGAADSVTASCVLCITDAQISGIDGSKIIGAVASATTAGSATTAATAGNALALGGVPASGYLPTAGGTVTGNLNVGGTITGNGSGLTNINAKYPWQVVAGTTVQAQPNTGYILTNIDKTNITLPTNPAVGDILRIVTTQPSGFRILQNAGQQIWVPGGSPNNFISKCCDLLSVSSDGTKVFGTVASGSFPLQLSTDSGVTFTARESPRQWKAIASSADGVKLVAVTYSGRIYTSTDSGVSWTPRDLTRYWKSVASSSDGIMLVASATDLPSGSNAKVYISTDSGVNWNPTASHDFSSIASSSDGIKLVGVKNQGFIYTSTDAGATWTQRASSQFWNSVASSSDGVKLVAVALNDQIYTSTDAGVTWIPRESARSWRSVASSSDGVKLAAVDNGGYIYVSSDSGVSWSAREERRFWQVIAASANGTRLFAFATGSGLFRSDDSGTTWQVLTGPPGTTIGTSGYLETLQVQLILDLLYVGNGRFMLIYANTAVGVSYIGN